MAAFSLLVCLAQHGKASKASKGQLYFYFLQNETFHLDGTRVYLKQNKTFSLDTARLLGWGQQDSGLDTKKKEGVFLYSLHGKGGLL